MKVFTIIKSHSQRIQSKNFKLVCGKPLWSYLINELSSCQVFVNTDSEELIETLDDMSYSHVTPIRRSSKHIDWEFNSQHIGSPVMDMYLEFVDNYTTPRDEYVVLTHVTSPFLKVATLRHALALAHKHSYDSVVSVKRIQDFCFTLKGSIVHPINYNPNLVERTQDLLPVYQSLGAFFINKRDKLLQAKKREFGACHYYELSSVEALEIDYPSDLDMMDAILSKP